MIIDRHGISGLAWSQRVLQANRADYVSITYVEPWQENATVLGFDVASDPVRTETLVRARDIGDFSMTPPLQLLQDEKKSPGVVMYCPVYNPMNLINSVSAQRESLVSYATVIVRTYDLIDSVLTSFASGDYHLKIVDVSDPKKPQAFYHSAEFDIPAYAQNLVFHREIAVGGRRLLISVGSTEKFLTEHVSLQSWFVLAGGLLFCSLLGGFLLLISGRTQHISHLVEQRTKELAAILENAVESILVVDEQGLIPKANSYPPLATITPLTSTKGALGLVLSGKVDSIDDKIRDLLSRLVNDILDVDKLAFGNVQLSMNAVLFIPWCSKRLSKIRAMPHVMVCNCIWRLSMNSASVFFSVLRRSIPLILATAMAPV